MFRCKKLFKGLIAICCLYSTVAFAQSDSTNLPGLSTTHLTTPTTSSGTGVPNAGDLQYVTTTTEMMVDSCPTSGGNGYGYYPNGAVPGDGTANSANVNGGVIYERQVYTNRFGTTTYGGWTQVNFLCTAIPSPPGCPSGQVQTSAPYWDWGSNQWVGLSCMNPVSAATQKSSCSTAFAARGSTNSYMFDNFGSDNGAMSGSSVISTINNLQVQVQSYADGVGCWGSVARQSLSGSNPVASSAYEMFSWNYQNGQSAGVCWVNQGTNNVAGTMLWTLTKNPGTCH
jgi:hypothetical protein